MDLADRIFESVEFIFCLSNTSRPFLSVRESLARDRWVCSPRPFCRFDRETSGFLLFPRRAPLCEPDKAPRSRPLPYPTEIFGNIRMNARPERQAGKGHGHGGGCIKS